MAETNLAEQLNAQQRETLDELKVMGWSVDLVEEPGASEPVPVVLCDDGSVIGTLGADGRIGVNPAKKPEESEETTAEQPHNPANDVMKERRTHQPAVPARLSKFLNMDQLRTLHQMECFGWSLDFVRRPLFQEVVAVISSSDGKRVAALAPDGKMEVRTDLQLRSEEQPDTD